MPQTKCNNCGADLYISDKHAEEGAEVYCSALCATLPGHRPDDASDDATRADYAGCEPLGGGVEGYETRWDDTHDQID